MVLIFDFDGLILNTELAEKLVWDKMFSAIGKEFDITSHRESIGSFGIHPYKPHEVLAEAIGDPSQSKTIRTIATNQMIDLVSTWTCMPGVTEVMSQAKLLGIKTAIGSSSPFLWVNTHLMRLELWDKFDTIVTLDDVEACKPSPDIFLKVLERLDVSPKDALVLEDSANGVLAASRAGIRSVAIPNEITCLQKFPGACEILNSLLDLDLKKYFPF